MWLYIFTVVYLTISFFCILLIAYDLCFHYINKIYSYKTGQWANNNKWVNKVFYRGEIWLHATPTSSITPGKRLLLWDLVKKRNHHPAVQLWQKAALIHGAIPIKDKKKLFSIFLSEKEKTWIQKYNFVEFAYLSYVLMQACSPNELKKYRSAWDETYDYLKTQTVNKTILYRSNQKDLLFVDTLGFVVPFLTKYATSFSSQDAFQTAVHHIKLFEKALHPLYGTAPHAYDVERNLPLGLYDWGRGNGWYILALTEMRRTLLSAYDIQSREFKKELDNKIINLAERLRCFQGKDGGYSEVFFVSNKQSEATASVMIAILYHEAYTITKNIQYRLIRDDILNYLKSATRRNGALSQAQTDTYGIGLYSIHKDVMAFAQGMLMLLLKRIETEI